MTIFKSTLILLTLVATTACATFTDGSKVKGDGDNMQSGGGTDADFEQGSLAYYEKGEYEEDKSENSAQVRQSHWSTKYKGISGFFKRPPLFSSMAEARKYNRCLPIKIVGFSEAPGEVTMTAQQQNQFIKIIGLNRSLFVLSKGQRLPEIDRHFVKNLQVVNGARKLANATDYLCEGRAWKYMTKEQFLFINGRPDKVLKGKGKYKKTYQWIYQSDDKSQRKSYYFTNDLLWAWN